MLTTAASAALAAGAGATPARRLKVAVYQNKPKVFTDTDGKPAGLFPDILEAMALREGWQLEWHSCRWQECLDALGRGDLDLVPDVAYSRERDRVLDFHRLPVAESYSRVYARQGLTVDRAADLDKLRVSVLAGSIQEAALRALLREAGASAHLVTVETFAAAFDLVRQGQADAAVTNDFFGRYYHQRYDLQRTPVVLHAVALYFAVPEGRNGDLLATIDRYLGEWRAGPSPYYRALERWTQGDVVFATPGWVGWALGLTAALAAVGAAFVVALRREVTRRTGHLAEALDQSAETERLYRSLYDSLMDGFAMTTPEGRFLATNEPFQAMVGYDGAELADLTHDDLIVPGSRSKSKQELDAQVFGRGYTDVFEQEYRHKDGGSVPVGIRVSLIRSQTGEPDALWAIVRDISERRQASQEQARLQAALLRAERLEALGRLAGGVAHDFNNMLSVVLGHLDYHLGALPADAPIREDLLDMQTAAEQARGVANQLLVFARGQTTTPRVLDVEPYVRGSLNLLQRLTGDAVRIEIAADGAGWPVCIDPIQLGQILCNICLNAKDAMEGRGTIQIGIANVVAPLVTPTDGPSATADFVRLTVTDDGSGMDEETLAHVFEPFFTTKGVGKGTGLGLASVHGIVAGAGGRIDVDSTPGLGTRFSILLPRHPESSAETKNPSTGTAC